LGFLQPEDALFTCSVKQGIKARGSKMKMPMTTQKGEELTRGGNQGESQKRRFFLEREGEVGALPSTLIQGRRDIFLPISYFTFGAERSLH